MNLDVQTRSIETLRKQNKVLTLAVAAMSVAALLSTYGLVNKHDRIVIVPPALKEVAKIDWGKADAEYLKSFALYYATLMGSITPKNVEFLADRLSSITAPAIYPEVRKTLLALAKNPQFMSSGSSSAFVVESVIYDAELGLTFVMGDNQVFTGSAAVKHNPMVYEIDTRIEEGRPVVYRIVSYPGAEPRTTQWRRNHPDQKKEVAE